MDDAVGLDAAEDRVEFRIAHLEGVVVRFEIGPFVKIKRELLVHLHGSEMRRRPIIAKPEYAGEELRRNFLVPGGYDGVIEFDSPAAILTSVRESPKRYPGGLWSQSMSQKSRCPLQLNPPYVSLPVD